MTEAPVSANSSKKSAIKFPLIFGLLLATLGGGGGYFLSTTGLRLSNSPETESKTKAQSAQSDGDEDRWLDVAFVPVQPIVVSLGPNANSQHLRVQVQLEVPEKHKKDVEILLPRVVDALNSYLQVIDEADLSGSTSLLRLRSQMLHRIKLVVGKERVQDILIMEFVMN